MMTSWIPAPVGLVAVAAFLLVVGVHAQHAALMVGRHRLWHLIHILMAAAMVPMYLPAGILPVLSGAGVVVFGAIALLVAGTMLANRLRGNRIGVLWLLNLADLAWMAVMFALMEIDMPGFGAAGAVWFAGQALGWASGRFGDVLEHRGLGETDPPTHSSSVHPSGDGRTSSPVSPVLAAGRGARPGGETIDGGRHDQTVRVSLTVMSGGMAYMFLALAVSTDGMASMAGM